MNFKNRHFINSVLLAVFIFSVRSGIVRAVSPAEELLDQSGVKGGVVVHLGCGDGKLTAALYKNDRFLVCGLDTDGNRIGKAKRHIDSLGLYGSVWCEAYDGSNLPFGDNIVNCLVISERPDVNAGEIARVLIPDGVVLVDVKKKKIASSDLRQCGVSGSWRMYRKPRSGDIDEWTHFLYNASGNAVSRDRRAGRPRHMQWYAGPRHSRHHDALASLSAMTSGGGRFFYIYDEGPVSVVHRPPDWKLIARDAFNGKLLWKRGIKDWMTHLYNFRAGPKQLPRLLVSVGENVYTALGFSAPAARLDAATGETELVYKGSEKTEEIIWHNGVLLVVTGDLEFMNKKSDGCFGYWEMAEYEEPVVDKSIIAYDAAGGKRMWRVAGAEFRSLVPLSLCASGDRIFYLDKGKLHCLDLKTGAEKWASPFKTEGLFIRSYAPTVVARKDVVLCLKWNYMSCFSAETGGKLWDRNKGSMEFGAPADLFVIGGTAWTNPMRKSIWRKSRKNADGIPVTGINIPKSTFFNNAETGVGIDVHTGEVTDLLPFAHTQHHHRCYRDKATEQYIFLGHSGIQVVDLKTKKNETNRWVRGICQYGIMPANGYVYVPPDPCRCYYSGKINGFFALSEHNSWRDIEIVPAVQKGPAYPGIQKRGDDGGTPAGTKSQRTASSASGKGRQWPVYRADGSRSGAAGCRVPAQPEEKWSVDAGTTLTAPVIAMGRVFVADKNAYTVKCLDAEDGSCVWKYLANGQVDSPPSVYKGLCLFGCGDGSVYCLDAGSGHLAWRFKTSTMERRIGYEDRLASPVRIHGSVLAAGDVVYFAAGYSSNLDGGIRLYGLDVRTGGVLYTNSLKSGYWGDDGKWGYLDDILASSGGRIVMRQAAFTMELEKTRGGGLITAATGLLDDTWYHRRGWSARGVKGQLIVSDGSRFFSVVNGYTGLKRRRKGQFKRYNQVGHFHQKFTRYEKGFFPVGVTLCAAGKRQGKNSKRGKRASKVLWSVNEKFQPRAMILAVDTLCAAGWLDDMIVDLKTGRAVDPDNPDPHVSVLRMYNAENGTRISETKLEADPVFDGLAAAYGCLFISLKNGKLVKYGAADR